MVGQVLRLGEKPHMAGGLLRPDGRCPMPDVFFPMNEGLGATVRDWRGGAGGILGGATGVPSWGASGLSFVLANSQYVSLPTRVLFGASATARWTFAVQLAWTVTTNMVAFGEGLSSSSSVPYLILNCNDGAAGRLPFYWSGVSGSCNIAPTVTWNDGKLHWCHVVSDGVTVVLYKDGVKVGGPTNVPAGTVTPTNTSSLGILSRASKVLPFTGVIAAHVGWYGLALTPAQVAAHYADPYMWLRAQSPARFYSLPSAARIAAMSDYYRRLRAA